MERVLFAIGYVIGSIMGGIFELIVSLILLPPYWEQL
jgi:hypothetical protein